MKRSKHSLSHYKLLTCNMGQLVPVACLEVLPGDMVQHFTSALIRTKPLLAPVMHPVNVRIHHWYVPNRLLWEDFEEFITGGSDGEGDGSSWPRIASPTPAAGGLLDYLGLPVGVAVGDISALPARAYNLIFNEFYRDQDLVTERAISLASGVDATTAVTLASIAWEKDIFTSSRPWPQKGPEVTLPLGTTAPVAAPNPGADTLSIRDDTQSGLYKRIETVAGSNPQQLLTNTSAGAAGGQMYVDLSDATAVSVNTVREAFALQRYQEARALYGSRYTEYLRYLGVRSSDARLQRPEYLGGGKQTIAFSEVLQTGPDSTDDGVADLKGHGIAAMRSRRYRRFFEEHGIVLSLMSVRPRTMYLEGVNKMWTRSTKEDYHQKELEHIGQSEILNKEIFVAGASPNAVFGYNDRYAEYRHIQSQVAGEFRSTLNYWHLARDFASAPALNSDFVTCDPSQRIFAEQVNNMLWIMVNNSIQARRAVGRGGKPGRIV